MNGKLVGLFGLIEVALSVFLSESLSLFPREFKAEKGTGVSGVHVIESVVGVGVAVGCGGVH